MTTEAAPTIVTETPAVPAETIITDPPGTGETTTTDDPAPAETLVDGEIATDPTADSAKPRKPDWRNERIDRLTAEKHAVAAEKTAAEARAAKAEAELAALRGGATPSTDSTPTDPERKYTVDEVRQMANAQAENDAFTAECNKTYAKGVADYPDFKESLSALGQTGVYTETLIHAALESDDPARVLYELGKNPEKAIALSAFANKPVKLIAAVAKFAATLDKPAAISRAPSPIKPVGGTARPIQDLDRMSMDEFVKAREKAEAGRGRRH